nr:atlH [Penicillium chrysogenum]UOO01264.1 AtlH [Penicillium chrysogenum]
MAQSSPDFDNIQGDIWPGLSKKYEQFFFFQITSPDAFKPNLKRLLAHKKITTSNDAINNRKMIAKHRQEKPGVLQEIAAVNIAFTFKGMKKMYPEDGFKDDPYRKGMEGDMVNEGRDKIQEWDDAFKASNGGVDGVFFVCGTEKKVKETTAELAKNYFNEARGIKHVITLDGRERDGENYKHEHFGYLDAISQPRLTGFDEQCQKGDGNYQFMCRPGRIIVGHDGEMGNEPKLMHGDWAKDGSYLVIRKYKQFVPEFNNYLKAESQKLHLTSDQLGARMMGRWKSGCPVELHPDQDNPALARMNEFNYNPESGSNCPFAAHMRKVKPRIDNRDRDMNDIMRRGIPYGPEVGADEANVTKLDRGLIFTCYQSSISNGFQEIQRQWINKSTFPDGKEDYIGDQNPGQDCIVGQLVGRPRNDRDKVLTTAICNGKGEHTSTSYTPFIQSHGGDYFFSPSISLLQAMTKYDF